MSLSSYTKDGILTVAFDDARILEEGKLEQVGKELIDMLNQTTEERVKLVYAVKVRILEDEALELKPGMPADVRLELPPS